MAFNLKDLVTTQKVLTPPRIVIYGGQGLGKSTFGSKFPDPIFILTEEGVDNIETNKLPICERYEDLLNHLTLIEHDDHKYKTVVLDTGSGAERLINRYVCEKNKGVATVADIPFGKGYAQASELFADILDRLNEIRRKRKMIILIICHEQIERIQSPDIDPYDRYNIDLDKRTVPDLNRWADAIFFVRHKIYTKKVDESFGKDVYKAVAGGGRILQTEETPAYIAKNRYGLPPEFPFEKEGTVKAVLLSIKKSFEGEPAQQGEPIQQAETKTEEVKDKKVVTKKVKEKENVRQEPTSGGDDGDDLADIGGSGKPPGLSEGTITR